MKFREVQIDYNTIDAITDELVKGNLTQGEWIGFVEEQMKKVAQTEYAIAVSSGTMALKILLDCLGVEAGYKVIVPDVTFAVCGSVVMELGAEPVFIDVNPDTNLLNLDEVRRKVNNEPIKAIMAVRLGGEEVEGLDEFQVPVIIDSAHSMEPMPVHARGAIYSFHPSKIISGIEGGVICTNDSNIAEKARRLRNFGFIEGTREMGEDIGYKANMTNISALVVSMNLKNLDDNLFMRMCVRNAYNTYLGLGNEGLGMYMVQVDNPEEVCAIANDAGIPIMRHYPKPMSEMFFGAYANPNAKWVCDHLVSLPFHEHMTVEDVKKVCDIIKQRLLIK